MKFRLPSCLSLEIGCRQCTEQQNFVAAKLICEKSRSISAEPGTSCMVKGLLFFAKSDLVCGCPTFCLRLFLFLCMFDSLLRKCWIRDSENV